MSHGITETDNVYSVRQPMWHNLGVILEDYPTSKEAKKLVHDWEPVTEPLYRQVPTFVEHRHSGMCEQHCTIEEEPSTVFEKIESHSLAVRSDNNEPLGVNTSTYEPVTNQEMYDIAEALEGVGGDVRFETGGSLNGGSKVWLLLRLQEPLVLNRSTEQTATIPYYSLQNAHDGSGSFRGQATMTRIVCQNTAQMADFDAKMRGTEFTFRHTANVKDKIEEAKTALAGWRESVEAYQNLSAHLINLPMSDGAVQAFIEEFIPEPSGKVISDRVRNNIMDARHKFSDIYNESRTTEDIRGTAYGLVQSSVEYLNWSRRAHTAESRFKRSFLDRERMVTWSTNRALELAG